MYHTGPFSETESKIYELALYNPEVAIYLSKLDNLWRLRDMSNPIFRKRETAKSLLELEIQLNERRLNMIHCDCSLLDAFVWILGEVVNLKMDLFKCNGHYAIRLADLRITDCITDL